MKFDKVEVWQKMSQTAMVPVFYNADTKTARQVVKACYDGGVRAFEFTNRGDFAHEVFADVMRMVRRECPDMALGVGSVVDPATAALYIQLGADFVVGPLLNTEVGCLCNRRGVTYVPGCASPTEISMAQECGCFLVKVFPGDVLGPKFVKSILAPMPWTKVMVTGGVAPTEENLNEWFKAGAACVGMGSKLFPKEVIGAANWQAISAKCRETLDIITRLKRQD